MQADLIDTKTLKDLADARALRGALIQGRQGGWSILVRYGAVEQAVAAQRSRRPRLWRKLETAAGYVRHELGLMRFEVDAEAYEAGVAHSRPDTAARQRRAHQAAAHDAWFREEVSAGLAAADRGEVVSADDMERWFDETRRRLGRAAQRGDERKPLP